MAIQDLIVGIGEIASHCESVARQPKEEPLRSQIERLFEAIDSVALSWSGSWLGYHAMVYLRNFRPAQPGEHFDANAGLMSGPFTSHVNADWHEYRHEEVVDVILRRAGVRNTDQIDAAAKQARHMFDQAREALVPDLGAVLVSHPDEQLQAIYQEIIAMPNGVSQADFAKDAMPNQVIATRDQRANEVMVRTKQVPPHIAFQSLLYSRYSHSAKLEDLARLARRAERYLRASNSIGRKTMAETRTIFIGHGRSAAWRDLKDLLQDRLHLTPDEFNLQSAAGMPTTERLQQMLDSASFAFLVLTAEDEHTDGTQHARENVIHEAGLFQGRLGFKKAIALLEEGCAEFSNIKGLGQIRFPKGNIGAKSEEIRQVLEREGII